jgi:FKBP-type peptidyl-prolyl cis-trans isomerase
MMKNLLLAAILLVAVAGCKKDYDKIDKDRIEEYLKAKGITAQKTDSGVYYVIEKEGTGNKPKDDSEVTVNYKGYLLNDEEFDKGDSIYFYLNQVIPGWRDGLKEFKEGSSGKIFIPSSLAYGSSGSGSIPANEPVGFDIKLLGIDLVDKANKKEIRDYANKKGWKLDSLDSGLYYVIENQGTGINPTASSYVTVSYKGYFTDEKIFDGSTATFGLNNVIEGWRLGIPLFKKGGKGKLLIPSRLGYGSYGSNSGKIAPGKVLIFDIELIDF